MAFHSMALQGFRGFGFTQTMTFAIPNGLPGSGITIIVGPNNSGKTTIIEAFRAVSMRMQPGPSITEGRRNKSTDAVEIQLFDEAGNSVTLKSVKPGGSETQFSENGLSRKDLNVFVVRSRRAFSPKFMKGGYTRETLLNNDSIGAIRGENYNSFYQRLFQIQLDPAAFNELLNKVIDPVPHWTIDQTDFGDYYVKFNFDGHIHNSDGAGEGLLSVFTIIDAFYDSKPGDVIVIDEPELSLHPSLQRNICSLLKKLSADRQIVIATHSPFFVDWESFISGGNIVRVIKEGGSSIIHEIDGSLRSKIKALFDNRNNPHILGLDAREIFFLSDNILLVEGQEDVVFFKRLTEVLAVYLRPAIYGWGIGGAGNMDTILRLLKSLGFKKVSCVLDNNMQYLATNLQTSFKHYKIFVQPADDIRDKNPTSVKRAVEGLMDSNGNNVKPQYEKAARALLAQINEFHSQSAGLEVGKDS
ncbi:ATP-dependent nuclease [Dawidia soli]|uniref:AAA family ATPase n=1 Tax=Dawidia soli TaxID=2782352 RepID=A0AAP2DBD4_9BACT|nr:AAA family ATPase [Dawidia soli]MBT1688893.1 AAA family ATPase [Dawidia soli]